MGDSSGKVTLPRATLLAEQTMREGVGFMEHSGVNPSAAGGCKVEDPLGPLGPLTRSQVDVT